jgi:hypothetical protein
MKKVIFFVLISLICATAHAASVTSFGAVGDGKTNDTAALEKAFAAGGNIEIPAGVYSVNYLTIPSNVTITGDTGAILVGRGTGFKSTIITIASKNVKINSLIFDGNIATDDGITIEAAANGVVLNNCEIRNIYGTAGCGIIISSGAQNITVNDCDIHNISGPDNGIAGDLVGANRDIFIQQVKNTVISSCTLEGVHDFEDGDCIHVQSVATTDANQWAVSGVTIKDCIFKSFYKRALKLQASGVTVTGNIISSSYVGDQEGTSDIYACNWEAISSFGAHNVIENNNINVLRAHAGISVRGNANLVEKNIISVDPTGTYQTAWTCAESGIWVDPLGCNSQIIGNTILAKQNPVYIAPGAKNVTVK